MNKKEHKITPDIMYHFGYDLDKTVDFFTLPRKQFLSEYSELTDIHYNSTCLFWLNRINHTQYVNMPIFKIEGMDIAKIYRKNNLEPLDLFILCS